MIAWKQLAKDVSPPEGAIEQGGGFTVTVAMTSLLGCAGDDFAEVLKSLGYRFESKEVQRPVARKADEASSASSADADNSAAAGASAEEASAEDAGATAEETQPQEASVEAAVAETSVEAEAAADPSLGAEVAEGETETVTIQIWRPGRADRRPRPRQDNRRGENRNAGDKSNAGAGRGDKRAHGGKGRPGGKPQKGKGGGFGDAPRRDRAPVKDKPIDPNSPFAALLALKENMNSKDKS